MDTSAHRAASAALRGLTAAILSRDSTRCVVSGWKGVNDAVSDNMTRIQCACEQYRASGDVDSSAVELLGVLFAGYSSMKHAWAAQRIAVAAAVAASVAAAQVARGAVAAAPRRRRAPVHELYSWWFSGILAVTRGDVALVDLVAALRGDAPRAVVSMLQLTDEFGSLASEAAVAEEVASAVAADFGGASVQLTEFAEYAGIALDAPPGGGASAAAPARSRDWGLLRKRLRRALSEGRVPLLVGSGGAAGDARALGALQAQQSIIGATLHVELPSTVVPEWSRNVTAAALNVCIPPLNRTAAGKPVVIFQGAIIADTIKWAVTVDGTFPWPGNALHFVFNVKYDGGDHTTFVLPSTSMLRPTERDNFRLRLGVGGKLQPLELTREVTDGKQRNVLRVATREVTDDGAPACAASRAVAAVRALQDLSADGAPACDASRAVAAVRALRDLSRDDANQTAIAAAGGIPPLIAALNSPDAGVVAAAASALCNLAINDANQTAIAAAGGIRPLIKLLSSPVAGKVAASALWNLSRDAANQIKIAAAGGIRPLIKLLSSTDDAVAAAAASALWNLAINAANQIKIADAKGIPPLIKLLRSPVAGVVKAAASALCNLSVNAANQIKIADAKGIPPLIKLLRSPDAGVVAAAALALRNLAINDANQITIAAAEGIPPLIAALNSDVTEVVEAADETLQNLSMNAANRDTIAAARAAAATTRTGSRQ